MDAFNGRRNRRKNSARSQTRILADKLNKFPHARNHVFPRSIVIKRLIPAEKQKRNETSLVKQKDDDKIRNYGCFRFDWTRETGRRVNLGQQALVYFTWDRSDSTKRKINKRTLEK